MMKRTKKVKKSESTFMKELNDLVYSTPSDEWVISWNDWDENRDKIKAIYDVEFSEGDKSKSLVRILPKAPKPKVELIGSDSNVFLLLGKCAKALRRAGQVENEKELSQKVLQASSFDDALCIMMDYCELV